jgi:hypothetical protein
MISFFCSPEKLQAVAEVGRLEAVECGGAAGGTTLF